VIIAMGTIASTARPVIDDLRADGKRIGLVKLKCYRPFPGEEIRRLAENYQSIGVIDRNVSLGGGGNVFNEVRSNLYDLEEKPKVLGFHTGMAGDEVTPQIIKKIAEKTTNALECSIPNIVEWVGGT
jgi:pyruvate ferredoxin oxidoreductase alpha subunit